MTEFDRTKGLSGPVAMAMSILAHVFLLGPAVYVVVLCAQLNTSLFVWHPACMTVGCGLLMTEAILSISGEAFLAMRMKRVGRVTVHWVLHCLGLGLMVVGFATVVANKNRNNAAHFTSNHGIVGLTAFIVSLAVGLGGILVLNTRWFYPTVKPLLIKVTHIFGGVAAMILLLAALITGLYRGWWPGNDLGRSLAFAAYVIGGFLVLIKPIFAAVSKSNVLCKFPRS